MFREIIKDMVNEKKLKVLTESAIPSNEIDETIFEAKNIKKYLIVFVDIVNSTSRLEEFTVEKFTELFKNFHSNTIGSFRNIISKEFKFKMLGDGLLFFVPIDTEAGKLLAYDDYHKEKCNEFYTHITRDDLPIRVIGGYSELVEVDVGLANGWTDFYGVGINNIVHASKNIQGEFKWV